MTKSIGLDQTFDLVWMQSMGGGSDTIRSGIDARDALATLQAAQADASHGAFGPGVVVFLRPSGDVLAAVGSELERARLEHAPMASAHEAFAVILEELDEFKLEVWKKRSERDLVAMRAELIQLAAMAVRAVEDLEL